MAAIHGRWCPASATTSTRASGSLAAAGCACTRSSATATGCISVSRPAATMSARTVAARSPRPTRASVPASRLIRTRSSVNACTRWHATTMRRAVCTCRTTADGQSGRDLGDRGRVSACCAATTTAGRGDRSPKDCPRTSGFRSLSTRTTPTPCTSCLWSHRRARVQAPPPRCGAARMAATPGAVSPVGCRRSRPTSRCSATRWTSTGSRRPRSTSARRPVSCGSAGRAASNGIACSIRCLRFIT